jgi:hypothetical protein
MRGPERSCGRCSRRRRGEARRATGGLSLHTTEPDHGLRAPVGPPETTDVIPDTQYTESGDVYIAYQVIGDGPVDLVYVPGYASNLAYNWQWPPYARYLQRLGSLALLIVVDRRGTGLSDRASPDHLPTLEPEKEHRREGRVHDHARPGRSPGLSNRIRA